MPVSQHFVIVLYFAEICLAAVALAVCLIEKRVFREHHSEIVFLMALIVMRLIVKLFYFYVEFYITQLSLNIIMNFAMDSTYVLSLILTARLLKNVLFSSNAFPGGKRLTALGLLAGFFYIFVWMAIEILWVDPVSNHRIVIYGQAPQIIYFLNEAFFLSIVFIFAGILFRKASQTLKSFQAKLAIVAVVSSCIYALYVFLWDVSFILPSVEGIRMGKPLDGVLFFAGVVLILFFMLALRERRAGLFANGEKVGSEERLDAFCAYLDLTPREGEVLTFLYHGETYAEISAVLFISLNTVKRHTSNIYKKCGVHTRSQLISQINTFTKIGKSASSTKAKQRETL